MPYDGYTGFNYTEQNYLNKSAGEYTCECWSGHLFLPENSLPSLEAQIDDSCVSRPAPQTTCASTVRLS
jgi:hypothetical protein